METEQARSIGAGSTGRNDGRRRALIVGLGISGIATAIRLRQIGWEPVIVERAPSRRPGGYFIVLFVAGLAAARRLGILDNLSNQVPSGASYDVDRAGRRLPALSFQDFPGPPWMMRRGDLEAAAYDTLPDDVEVRYGTEPIEIRQDADGATVTLASTETGTETSDGTSGSGTERFDLVVGADGLRSTVRRLVFGPHQEHLRRLDHMAVAFQLPGPLPGHDRTDTVILLEPGRSMWSFPFRNSEPTGLLTYRTDDVDAEFVGPIADRVRRVFGPEPTGPVLGAALDALETADNVLFDSVEQVHLDSWHRGRVVLVGDAAWCVTLYAGMGASSGMAGADLLGTMLARHPLDIPAALAGWERHLRPRIEQVQRNGLVMRKLFVPPTPGRVTLRRVVARLNSIPATKPLLTLLRTRNGAFKLNGLDFADPDLVPG